MPRGKTKSTKTLGERREAAYRLFRRGYTDVEVARKVKVTRQTAANYRKLYEAELGELVLSNPDLLRDALKNTFRNLGEIDEVRENAWKQLDRKEAVIEFHCDECGNDGEVVVLEPPGDDARTKYLGVILKSTEMRAKVLGTLGIKTEVLAAIADLRQTQDAVLRWLSENLDGDQRMALAEFLEGPQLAGYQNGTRQASALDAIDAQAIEAIVS